MGGLVRQQNSDPENGGGDSGQRSRVPWGWRWTLGRKLFLVTATFLLLWAGHACLSYQNRQCAANFAGQINEAGKLRMHSQRIAYLAMLCDGTAPPAACQTSLQQVIIDYDRSLAVVQASPWRYFLHSDRRHLAAAITALQADWVSYRLAAQAVVSGHAVQDLHSYIGSQSERLLNQAEALTELLITSQRRAQKFRYGAQNVLQLTGLLMLLALTAVAYRQGVLPLRELARLARRAGRGDYRGNLKYLSGDEVGELVTAFNESNKRTQLLLNELAAEARAARHAEAATNSLLESAADGLIISDYQGKILRINREAERIFDYPRQELVGRSVQELVPPRLRHTHRRYHANYVLAPATRAMGRTAAVPGLRKDGSEVPVEISLSPAQFDGQEQVIAVVRDVTQRLQAEADRQRLLAILDATPDVVAIFLLSRHLVYLNPAGRRLLGVTDEEPIDEFLLDELLTPAASALLHERALPVVLSTSAWRGELVLCDWAGNKIPVSQQLIAHQYHSDQPRYFSMIARDISERKQHEAELLHRATHDQLTGLVNRTLFEDRLKHALFHAQRSGQQVAVVFIDLDNFKLINDTMGHAAGDALLCEVAFRLQAHLRQCDTKARLGGDEFALILEQLRSADDAAQIVRSLAAALRRPVNLRGREVVVTSSMGISMFPADGNDVESLLMQADTAMYEAKASGRNSYRFYTAEMNLRAAGRLDLENALRLALEREELRLHYQPVMDAKRDLVIGCEALLRWQHPEQGLLPPNQFIAVAEESGLIVPIGQWVLEQACRQISQWRSQGLLLDFMAVNVSARQLREPALAQVIETALDKNAVKAEQLEIELTEGSVLHGTMVARQILDDIQELGVRLVADDFGTGYSSLSYLKLFRFDKVKIDRQFVRDILSDQGDAAIVKATIAMAHAFGATAVAEGVESPAQVEMLRQYGCDQLQGYFYSRPMAADAFRRRYRSQSADSSE